MKSTSGVGLSDLRRIAIAGVSGSGKSSLALRLSNRLAVPYLEMDSIYYGSNWSRRDDFEHVVSAYLHREKWITDWAYEETFSLLKERAQVVIWLDYPTLFVFRSVILRNLLRRLHQQDLWETGTFEGPLISALWNRQHAVRYALGGRKQMKNSMEGLISMTSPPTVFRMTSPKHLNKWLKDLDWTAL